MGGNTTITVALFKLYVNKKGPTVQEHFCKSTTLHLSNPNPLRFIIPNNIQTSSNDQLFLMIWKSRTIPYKCPPEFLLAPWFPTHIVHVYSVYSFRISSRINNKTGCLAILKMRYRRLWAKHEFSVCDNTLDFEFSPVCKYCTNWVVFFLLCNFQLVFIAYAHIPQYAFCRGDGNKNFSPNS